LVQGVVGYGSSGLLGLGFSGGLQGGIEGIAGLAVLEEAFVAGFGSGC
jgi:hypothetical protein